MEGHQQSSAATYSKQSHERTLVRGRGGRGAKGECEGRGAIGAKGECEWRAIKFQRPLQICSRIKLLLKLHASIGPWL